MSKTNNWIYTDHKIKGNMQSLFFYILVTDIKMSKFQVNQNMQNTQQ